MSNNVQIRTLKVQASQSADLSFNMPGIIAYQNFDHTARSGPAFLGSRVPAFDLDTKVYVRLGETTQDPSRLKFDSRAIKTLVAGGAKPPYLFGLRNEALSASLDQMLERRQAAYRDRFGHAREMEKIAKELTPAIIDALESLHDTTTRRYDSLKAAYDQDGLNGVRKMVKSRAEQILSTSTTQTRNLAMVNRQFSGSTEVAGPWENKFYEKDTSTLIQRQEVPQTGTAPLERHGNGWKQPADWIDTQSVTTQPGAAEQQTATDMQAYTHPVLDALLARDQALTSIFAEMIRARSSVLRNDTIEKVMMNELAAMDLEIRAVQVNLAHTFLLSPFAGVVTGIYKDLGESVEPGEPVLRVENDAVILAVGQINYRSRLWVGRPVEIKVGSVFEGGSSKTLKGKVVSIRGHESDDDEWEVIFELVNPKVQGQRLLPINYSFDRDSDTVEFQ